jgi:hypothetical protein
MAVDETITADAAPEKAAASEKPSEKTEPRLTAVAAAGMVSYVVQHRLLHDGHEYRAGDAFQSADTKVIAALRKAGAIALLTEVMAADDVAQRMAAAEAEAERLREELARLQALQAASANASASKSGK